MHLPSTMSGEEAVKNLGQSLVSLRHTTLPVVAFKQETSPRTPTVQILPSATTGVQRGPAWMPPAARVAPSVAYLSSHTILPLAASMHVMTSFPPCRAKA